VPEHGRQRARFGGVGPTRLSTSITIGIDLASRPAGTAVCVISWDTNGARVTLLTRGRWGERQLDDGVLCDLIRGETEFGLPAKVAIDAPFGWPEPFVDAVRAHHDRTAAWPPSEDRQRFALRTTDLRITKHPERLPLSVSTDRIAYCAMRCAALLGRLEETFGAEAMARDGSGLVAEVYPEAALRRWLPDLWTNRETYKGKDATSRRTEIIDALADRLGSRFELAGHGDDCIKWDDCLDALVCALVGRAAAREHTVTPCADDRRLALAEGWIHLPAEDSLGQLYDTA
jgi:hypothetical protein